ncbi:MAG: FecR family protein [Bacteroidales bacterium]|nr:FecR family protein [Bacteroidales bacterium]
MNTFFNWLKNKNEHVSKLQREEFEALDRIWNTSRNDEPLPIPDPREKWMEIESRLEDTDCEARKINFKIVLPIAASLVLFIALGSIMLYFGKTSQHYTTTHNKMEVTLPDNSTVTLNRHSKISYPRAFGKINRKITLEGEAFFNVSKNINQPFVVTTKSSITKVVGTQFNIKVRNSLTEIGVTEGQVNFFSIKKKGKVQLSKGMFSSCYKDSLPQVPTKFHINEFPGWMYNKIIFNNTALEEIAADLEKIFDIEIEISSSLNRLQKINGVMEETTPEEAMEVLSSLLNCSYKKENCIYILK